MEFNNNSIWPLLLGWLISNIFFAVFRGIEFLNIVFMPGYLIMLFFCFYYWRKLIFGYKRNIFIELIIVGSIIDSIPYWLLREGTGSAVGVNDLGFFKYNAIKILFLLPYVLIMLSKKKFYSKKTSTLDVKLFFLVFLVSIPIGFFRISNFFLSSLENEERSFFLFGIEIHHIITGVVLLLFFYFLEYKRVFPLSNFTAYILIILYGIIFDQASYMILRKVTDEAYLGVFSLIGAVLFVTIFSVYNLLLNKYKGNQNI